LELEMGKTHEALEIAEKEFEKHRLRSSRELPSESIATPFERTSSDTAKEVFDDLKTTLLNWGSNRSLKLRRSRELPSESTTIPSKRISSRTAKRGLNDLKTDILKGPIKSILFMGTSDRDGSYAHAITVASALTKDSRLRVVLVDLSLWTLSLHELFKIDDALGLLGLDDSNGETKSKIKKMGPGNLYTVRWGRNHAGTVKPFESSRFGQFLKMMERKFDYVILNASSVSGFSECQALCAKVDGVVLVLEAGETGRQFLLRAREQVVRGAENKLLGAVLDRHRAFQPRLALIIGAVALVCLIFTLGLSFGRS
jgi:Mrp family chromosome partitioning ATPase